MQKHIIAATIFTLGISNLSALALADITHDTSQYPPREVPARTIPVPTTVSPELQKAIAEKPSIPALNRPNGAEDLIRLREQMNKTMIEQARLAMKELRVTATPETIAGVPVYSVIPADIAPTNRNRLIIHLHGGGFVFGGGEAAIGEAAFLAYATETPVISIDYRMPPEHPFPASIDDVVKVWQSVVQKRSPKSIAIGGSSAGGNLTMAAVLKLKEVGEALPGALFIGTPAVDLSSRSDTCFTNEFIDNVLTSCAAPGYFELYAGSVDLKTPLVSPIYGDLENLPPSILISGTRDALLSDTVRAHRKLRAKGIKADLHVFDALSHAQYLMVYPGKESQEALGEIAKFFDKHLKR